MNLTQQPTRIPVQFFDEDSGDAAFCAEAMSRARAAQESWAALSVLERLTPLRNLRALIAQHCRALAEASAATRSRPLAEVTTAEVLPLAEACRFLERKAAALLAPARFGPGSRPVWLWGVRSEIRREPYGVVLIIGPGNYPLLLPGVQLIQALIAGNAVLLKPGLGGTPAAALLCELLAEAGFPADLVVLLTGTVEAARSAILANPDKVLFTGAAATGREILLQLAPKLIPATVELSGCDAVIVRADADLDLTAKALVFGLQLNAGASCVSPKRAFVAAEVATELETRLGTLISRFDMSYVGSRTRSQGPFAWSAPKKLRPLVEQALSAGAHRVPRSMGIETENDLPIILAQVPEDARILKEDIFWPVLSIVPVSDDREALRLANDCPFALGASIFSRDEAAARALAGLIDTGVVTINDLIVPTADPRLPFGGRRSSGFGVTRGAEGLLELTRPKVVSVTRATHRPAFEPPANWHEQLFAAYLRLSHDQRFSSRAMGLFQMLKLLLRNRKTLMEKSA